MADICPIKGASDENVIFYFFSRHNLIGQHTKFQTGLTPPSCFLQITSQIFDVNDQTQISIINFWQFCIIFWWKMSAKWSFTFKHFKFPLLPLLTHSAIMLTTILFSVYHIHKIFTNVNKWSMFVYHTVSDNSALMWTLCQLMITLVDGRDTFPNGHFFMSCSLLFEVLTALSNEFLTPYGWFSFL